MRLAVERLSGDALNRIRFVSIALCALMFGIFLRSKVLGGAPPVGQFAMVSALEHTAHNAQLPPYEFAPAPQNIIIEEGGGDAIHSRLVPAPEIVKKNSPIPLRQDPIILSARAAMLTNGKISRAPAYQKNADARLPIASLTKLMTAVAVVEYGRGDDIITVSKNAVATEGVSGGFTVGEKLTVSDMLKALLIVSSNDAAVALEEYFASLGFDLVALMNKKAARLGMTNTHFTNASGLDADGHYATARDLAILGSYSLAHEYIWDILSRKSATIVSTDGRFTHHFITNNELVQKSISGVKGGKTGYTKNALGCMITVLEDGSVAVVLGSDNREEETKKLIKITNYES